MQTQGQPPVVILRHPKERRSKCSVQPLKGQAGYAFFNARQEFAYDATGHIVLAVDAPPLSPSDAIVPSAESDAILTTFREHGLVFPPSDARPILLLDSTWRLLPQVLACVKNLDRAAQRSLPGDLKTAYPRVSKTSADPDGGLASVEALYAALHLLGWQNEKILAAYRWKDAFLAQF